MTNPFEPPHAELSTSEPATGRPVAITIICVIGFLGALIAAAVLFTPIPGRIGAWYPPMLGGATVVGFVCMIGLWKMKKWAVYTYTAVAVANQAVMAAMGLWTIGALVIPAIVIGVMWAYVAKMS